MRQSLQPVRLATHGGNEGPEDQHGLGYQHYQQGRQRVELDAREPLDSRIRFNFVELDRVIESLEQLRCGESSQFSGAARAAPDSFPFRDGARFIDEVVYEPAEPVFRVQPLQAFATQRVEGSSFTRVGEHFVLSRHQVDRVGQVAAIFRTTVPLVFESKQCNALGQHALAPGDVDHLGGTVLFRDNPRYERVREQGQAGDDDEGQHVRESNGFACFHESSPLRAAIPRAQPDGPRSAASARHPKDLCAAHRERKYDGHFRASASRTRRAV